MPSHALSAPSASALSAASAIAHQRAAAASSALARPQQAPHRTTMPSWLAEASAIAHAARAHVGSAPARQAHAPQQSKALAPSDPSPHPSKRPKLGTSGVHANDAAAGAPTPTAQLRFRAREPPIRDALPPAQAASSSLPNGPRASSLAGLVVDVVARHALAGDEWLAVVRHAPAAPTASALVPYEQPAAARATAPPRQDPPKQNPAGAPAGSAAKAPLPRALVPSTVALAPADPVNRRQADPSAALCPPSIALLAAAAQAAQQHARARLAAKHCADTAAAERASTAAAGPSSYQRFNIWARTHGNAAQRARIAQPSRGPRTRLLTQPIEPPSGYTPEVFGLRACPKELALRLREACRIVPALHPTSYCKMLGEAMHALSTWPRDRLLRSLLDAVCAWAGHARLAALRCMWVDLDEFSQEEFGTQPMQFTWARTGATQIREFLLHRQHEADVRDEAARMRKAAALAEAATSAGDDAARAGLEEEERAEGGAAPCALSLLRLGARAAGLSMECHHQLLDQYHKRPPTRKGARLPCPELGVPVKLELTPLDPTANEFEQGSAALAALSAHVCVRAALAARSQGTERAEHGTLLCESGMDLKKHEWRVAGRPLICSRYGYSGDDTWATVAEGVLGRDDFSKRHASILRAHNGPDGDPSRATRWLDRPPTAHEHDACIAHLISRPLSRHGETAGSAVRVSPDPACRPDMPPPHVTKHLLKCIKPTAYSACRVHPDYMVEAAGHAGSSLEQLSMQGMRDTIKAVRPKGHRTALGYARGGTSLSIAEVDLAVFETVRAYVAQASFADLACEGSWDLLTKWALAPQRAA